ncbi:MAG: PIN domain-containing protein, partial [Candidatus Bipolaricaulota bacterium]|nr:PIN domain-containing protein [Candidatus Bipolaricaulota bacterium]
MVEPYTVLVEIVSAIKRRTKSENLAKKVQNGLLNLGTMYFIGLEAERAKEAAEIAQKTGVRGMDAIVAQTAKEFDASLVTLDENMITRLKKQSGFRALKSW